MVMPDSYLLRFWLKWSGGGLGIFKASKMILIYNQSWEPLVYTICPLAQWFPILAMPELPVQFVKPKLLEHHTRSTTWEFRVGQGICMLTNSHTRVWSTPGRPGNWYPGFAPVSYIFKILCISSKYYQYLFL